ncbi:MAG: ubiquitin-conjugating enzyme E2 [Armatimonadota bacterium]
MNARLRRLYADHQMVMDEFAGHPKIDVTPVQGDPPEVYQVIFHIKGLELDENTGRPKERNYHEATIYLHRDYPREKPKCDLKTPIFHPNFGSYICIGDHWAAGETLVDVIMQIGEMIAYQSFNPKSPLNATAARWAKENEQLFPIDDSDLYQPEVDIDLLGEQDADDEDDDLEIELL